MLKNSIFFLKNSLNIKCLISKKVHTMKLSEDQMQRIMRPGVQQLADIFTKNGYELRLAGGSVRDVLMGKTPDDLDFATTATPTEMKRFFQEEEIRLINMNGEKHGTITPRIQENSFECTTLRIDQVTDGRHAEVEFIKNWEIDAGRRDLTVNSMFLGLDGTLYDYFNGIEHIEKRLVTFVGDPSKRIQEDYLRILRYFRFYARIAKSPDDHDENVIEIIKQNVTGLGNISKERLWIEVKKIVPQKLGAKMIRKMCECGIGPYIALPPEFDCTNVDRICDICERAGLQPSDLMPISILAAGMSSKEDVKTFVMNMKCSNKERDAMTFIIKHRDTIYNCANIKVIHDLLVDLIYKEKKSIKVANTLISELLKYTAEVQLLKEIEDLPLPKFPLGGGMLVSYVAKRKDIPALRLQLIDIWKESNFTLSTEELIQKAKDLKCMK